MKDRADTGQSTIIVMLSGIQRSLAFGERVCVHAQLYSTLLYNTVCECTATTTIAADVVVAQYSFIFRSCSGCFFLLFAAVILL